MWYLFALGSAFFLGIYDVAKKISLQHNAVIPVLFWSTFTTAILLAPWVILSRTGILNPESLLYVPVISVEHHLMLLLKAAIVLFSWIFVYYGLKHLPLSYVAPIRATAPIWTLLGALLIFHERLNLMQWSGIGITFIFFFLFSLAGKHEGLHWKSNKYIWFILVGTLAGAASSLYDKFLLGTIDRMAVQCYHSFYQVLLMVPISLILYVPRRRQSTPFEWRWSIPLIGLFLVVADFLYFYAISIPGSLIALISALRRSNAVVSFSLAAVLFKEKKLMQKALLLVGIAGGIALVVAGSM